MAVDNAKFSMMDGWMLRAAAIFVVVANVKTKFKAWF